MLLLHASYCAAPPHISFLLADDLGWNDVSFHGSSQIPTPNIDALAAKGVSLDNYYVNPVCSPTRASLMSGRSMIHTGIQTPYGAGDDASGLNLSYSLLPQQLKQRFGYATAMIGKWHLGMKTPEYLPSSRGFDKFFGCARPKIEYYCGVMDYWKHYEDLGDGGKAALDLHVGGIGLGLPMGRDVGAWNTSGQYSTAMFARKAATWIAEHSQTEPERPFFLYLAFQASHSANNKYLQAPDAYIDRFAHVAPDVERCSQYEMPTSQRELPMRARSCTKRGMRRTVAATVAALDDAVGDVVEALRRAGMYANSLVIFSTDNGGPTDGTNNNMMNNFPLRSGKGELFEGGIRGVGVVCGPPLVKTAYVSTALFHVSDWMPTLIRAAGGDARTSSSHSWWVTEGGQAIAWQQGDGVDNWEALSRGGASARTEIVHAAQADGSKIKAWALRVREMKLVYGNHGSINGNQMPRWYPPPGLPWNYSQALTVRCGEPPTTLDAAGTCDNVSQPCLYNITSDPCEYRNLASEMPDLVSQMLTRLQAYKQTTVLTWENFVKMDPRSQPTLHGPTGPMVPDPMKEGPHRYEGEWRPWLKPSEGRNYYPSKYDGPGYPPKGAVVW